MSEVLCPCIDCIHNGACTTGNSVCTLDKITFGFSYMNTVNEGLVSMWKCNQYEMPEQFSAIEKSFKNATK